MALNKGTKKAELRIKIGWEICGAKVQTKPMMNQQLFDILIIPNDSCYQIKDIRIDYKNYLKRIF